MHRLDHNLDFQPQRTTVWVKVQPDGGFLFRHLPQGKGHSKVLIPCRSTTFFVVFRLQNERGAFATHPVQWSDPQTRQPVGRPPNIQVVRADDRTVTLSVVNPGNPEGELRADHFHLVAAVEGRYVTSPDPTIIEQETPPGGGGGG